MSSDGKETLEKDKYGNALDKTDQNLVTESQNKELDKKKGENLWLGEKDKKKDNDNKKITGGANTADIW